MGLMFMFGVLTFPASQVYYLFPLLASLRHLDHVSRFAFPFVYLLYVVVILDEVGWGRAHMDLLSGEPCYNRGSNFY